MNLISTDLNQYGRMYISYLYFRLHRYFRTSIFLLDAQAQSQIDDNFWLS